MLFVVYLEKNDIFYLYIGVYTLYDISRKTYNK